MTSAAFHYSSSDNIWFVDIFARARFTTPRDVIDTFHECRRYWKQHIGKRCYIVVDYTDTFVDKAVAGMFAEERGRMVEACQGSMTQRLRQQLTDGERFHDALLD